jgi:hypothetical protein
MDFSSRHIYQRNAAHFCDLYTWFAHDIKSMPTLARLLDFFPIYLTIPPHAPMWGAAMLNVRPAKLLFD